MDIIVITGYILAVLIGISLGLIGGGGSILTVPVLIYFFSIDVVSSTAYSLFIVGITALIGAVRNFFAENIELKVGIIFAIPSMTGVWLTRSFLIPIIPQNIQVYGDFAVGKDQAILMFFAFILIISSFSMMRKRKENTDSRKIDWELKDYLKVGIEGIVVGVVTGIIGAGGGFLIVPALVLLAKIPMKKAVGTSLMIIAAKSLIGFTGDLFNPEINIDLTLMIVFTGLSVIGIFIGGQMSKYISGDKLKKGFGWFLLIVGIYMMTERILTM